MVRLSAENSDDAEADILRSASMLREFSDAHAERFLIQLTFAVERLCRELPERIDRRVPLNVDEAASLHFSRPVYRERFETTAHRSRRSASGVWFLYYLLIDGDRDGQPEILRVVAVRHASARPYSVEDDAE